MQLQTLNFKVLFIGFLWVIVAFCAIISLYHFGYIHHFGYTDLRMWIDMGFYGAIAFCAAVVAGGFKKREIKKRLYKKQIEILNLFEENSNQDSISLNQILSKTPYSESETKGLLENLVEKKILIPNFSEEQELLYITTNEIELEKYVKKIH
jgi:hypothetical protein